MRAAAAKPQALLLALLAAVLVLLIPSYSALHNMWVDTGNHTYTHGYLVLAICLWLTWRALPRALATDLTPAPWLLAPLVIASAGWAVALTAGLQDVHLLLLPVITWLAVAAAFGWRAGRELLLPIGYIAFALPFWSSGNFILQQITVWVNGFLVWATGMVAYVHGNFVVLPTGGIEISDGCSGLHFFIVGLAVAVLYGEQGHDTPRRRIEWIVLAAGLAMVANWLRVFTITAAGYLTDMQHYLVRVDHYVFGWFVFAGTLIIFFWIANRRSGAAAAIPVSIPHSPSSPARNTVAAGMTLLVAGVFPLLAWRAMTASAPEPAYVNWPAFAGSASDVASAGWAPVYPGASAIGQRSLQLPSGATVAVFQAVYARQRQGAEMVGSGSSLFGDAPVSVTGERVVRAEGDLWRQWQVTSGSETALVRARWQIGKQSFVRPSASQLWYGVARLFTPVTSRVMALRALCAENCVAAQAALDEAGNSSLPSRV